MTEIKGLLIVDGIGRKLGTYFDELITMDDPVFINVGGSLNRFEQLPNNIKQKFESDMFIERTCAKGYPQACAPLLLISKIGISLCPLKKIFRDGNFYGLMMPIPHR